ncbi:GAF and ANTAR domain-containing protein [Mycobacterium sp.]|uniref:GAF and ANTAR domain-containing protein n=1 Tax=Mycobacterium sp. TaxID=1785 RepID=UPI003F7CE551
MSNDGNIIESSGLRRPPADGSVERQHLYTVLNQVVEVVQGGETDPDSALLDVIKTSVVSIPGAQYAGITLVEQGGDITTVAATHDFPRWLDDVQREVGEGPCLSAAWNQHTIRIDDLASDDRWPRYRDMALERTPVRSVLSFRLFDDGKVMGALNFHADGAGAFDDESIEVGLIFAANTTLAWNSMRREQQFQSALASRDIIGQAKGMLMERFDISAMAAFELLCRLSQQSNTRLADIAERLIAVDHPPTKG